MLLSSFSSPRRLAFLALGLFLIAIVLVQRSSYREYLPKYDIPGLSGSKGGEQKSSLEEDLQEPERIEEPLRSSSSAPEWGQPEEHVQTMSRHAGPTSSSERYADGFGALSTPASSTATATSGSTSASSTLPTHSPSASHSSVGNSSAGHHASPHESYESVQMKIQELIKGWTPPPIGGHWPPYDGYYDATYDPNRWEGFEWDNDFYVNNGIKQLQQDLNGEKPQPYLPYPDDDSRASSKEGQGTRVPCKGPRGKLLNESDADIVRAFPALPEGFPEVAVGSANVSGIELDYCFDRYNRYGPYGYGQDETGYVDNWQRPTDKPDWNMVNWGELQDRCVIANRGRFGPQGRNISVLQPGQEKPETADKLLSAETPAHKSRTALLIRTWEGYDYTENDIQALRALIVELNLLSGGEYQVFLLVNIKDNNILDIYDPTSRVYQDILEANVPKEFHDISVLWSESIFPKWYPDIGDWQVYWHQFLPLIWFSKTRPEFEYVWNWETDARYTGSHYQFLEAVANFSKQMPRKYLWERNHRFYFPAAHGSYEDWLADTDQEIERGMREGTANPVWGPQPYEPAGQEPIGPTPPRAMEDDHFDWGVGEEADLITLQPIWDPTHTEWTYRNKIWNYIPGVAPELTADDPLDDDFDHPDFVHIPRRTYINTLSRFSRRQLHAMHVENLAGRAMQAEMWPASVALQHGLKAVYAPHPIWTDRKWPAWYLDAIFNSDAGQPAQWGQQVDSVYNHDREHNFVGWSWYYQSEFPKALYRRWLGWPNEDGSPLSHVGGPGFEENGVEVDLPEAEEKGAVKVGGKGRLCLPPMLLHPVKKVRESEKGRESYESY
ncbi:hypothetical protein KC351_g2736 [Hortaea werneckii]|nr:hypothetical protein KC351_g2736 [Hortaea werneckii]